MAAACSLESPSGSAPASPMGPSTAAARTEMLRAAAVDGPIGDAGADPDGLSGEKAAAIRAAVEHGYYETPRDVDVSELADHLDVPRSTLTYRLRRAEATIVKRHVAGERPLSTSR